jgi:hypothetical protein
MIGLLRGLHSAERRRREYLARCQDFDDPTLSERLISAVDNAITNAKPDQIDTDDNDGVEHTCVWWRWNGRDLSVQRTIHPDRQDHAIYVDGSHFWSDPDAGPWLVTLDAPVVRFMPGCGFDTPTALLDWFEGED